MPDEQSLALLISVFGISKGKVVEGRTRVQKLVCDLQFERKVPLKFNFRSYFYGPYSEDLADLISDLVGLKILEEEPVQIDYWRRRYDYRLSEQGKILFDNIYSKLKQENPELLTRLTQSIAELDNIPTPTLIEMAKEASQMQSIS